MKLKSILLICPLIIAPVLHMSLEPSQIPEAKPIAILCQLSRYG